MDGLSYRKIAKLVGRNVSTISREIMLANGVPMKQIQEWLGHSDFSTTANIYAHLDYHSKQASADAMIESLNDALSVFLEK